MVEEKLYRKSRNKVGRIERIILGHKIREDRHPPGLSLLLLHCLVAPASAAQAHYIVVCRRGI